MYWSVYIHQSVCIVGLIVLDLEKTPQSDVGGTVGSKVKAEEEECQMEIGRAHV